MRSLFYALCALLLFVAPLANGQGANDPLKKPHIWRKLASEPTNVALWQAYFGKDIFEFSDVEHEQWSAWRKELLKAREGGDAADRQRASDVYKYGQLQDPYYQNLISNLHGNFVMIEDYFSEQFKFYNQTYTFYSDKYPKGNFNRETWISEQEQRLTVLQKQQ